MLNAAKFDSRPLLECRVVTLPIYRRVQDLEDAILHLAKFRYGATATENV